MCPVSRMCSPSLRWKKRSFSAIGTRLRWMVKSTTARPSATPAMRRLASLRVTDAGLVIHEVDDDVLVADVVADLAVGAEAVHQAALHAALAAIHAALAAEALHAAGAVVEVDAGVAL